MAKISTKELQADLLGRIAGIRSDTLTFDQYSDEQLFHQPAIGSWSANQCFDHLHLVQSTYLQNILKGLDRYNGPASESYSEGLVGGWFYKKMLPIVPGSSSSKVKTFKKVEPSSNPDAKKQFLESLSAFQHLLNNAQNHNLEKVRVISLAGPVLKFKLGDAYRIVVAHNERHLAQAQRAILI